MKNNEKIDVDVFKFRPEIDIDLDVEIYTTEHDCTKHDISLEDMELYIEKLLECDMDVRIKIHDKLMDLAKKILKGDELLKGYVIDYDSGVVDRNCKVHAIDWNFAKAWIEDARKEEKKQWRNRFMSKTYYISGAFTGTHKEFVDEQTLNIRNRLKEVYGETLPRELDEQIRYIVGEIYNATRNHCAQVWNVEPKKGW